MSSKTFFWAVAIFHDGGPYHIETSPLICTTNCSAIHWTGSYMIGNYVMKALNSYKTISAYRRKSFLFTRYQNWNSDPNFLPQKCSLVGPVRFRKYAMRERKYVFTNLLNYIIFTGKLSLYFSTGEVYCKNILTKVWTKYESLASKRNSSS